MANSERTEKIRMLRLALAELQIWIIIDLLSDTVESNRSLCMHKLAELELKRLLIRLDKNQQFQ